MKFPTPTILHRLSFISNKAMHYKCCIIFGFESNWLYIYSTILKAVYSFYVELLASVLCYNYWKFWGVLVRSLSRHMPFQSDILIKCVAFRCPRTESNNPWWKKWTRSGIISAAESWNCFWINCRPGSPMSSFSRNQRTELWEHRKSSYALILSFIPQWIEIGETVRLNILIYLFYSAIIIPNRILLYYLNLNKYTSIIIISCL